MFNKTFLLLCIALGCINVISAQNNSANMYALNIEQGKILKDSRGSYLEILVTLTNNDKDTLFYANYPCSWQNFYKPDNSVLQTEEMLCSKNLTEVHTLAPGNSSTVLLKLYFKYGLPTYEVKFRVGFNLLKVPGLYYSITPEDLNSKKYLWSNSITIEPDPAVVAAAQKKSWINPWEGINGYRFSAGYIKDLEIEASYLVTSYPEKDPGFGGFAMLVHYLGVGAEYVKDGPRNAFGAKLSYEASFNILAAQLGTDYLVTDKDQQLRIMPKVGLSLFGMLTIYYGRNYNIFTKSSLQPYKHIVTLQLNLYDFLISDNK